MLGDVVDCRPDIGRRTVAELLEHRSGLCSPTWAEAATVAPAVRADLALRAAPVTPPLAAGETLYTEAAAWMALGEVVRALAGPSLARFVRARVLAPLDIGDEFDLGDGDEGGPDPGDGRLRINLATRDGRRLPILVERTPLLGWETNPGYGGRASVPGLVALADEVTRARQGRGAVLSPAVAAALVRPGPVALDRTLGRSCTFGRGWMTGLADHRFGPALSGEAFGHVGLAGMTAVWSDPRRQQRVGYHVNGLADGETSIDWLRPALVDALTANLA